MMQVSYENVHSLSPKTTHHIGIPFHWQYFSRLVVAVPGVAPYPLRFELGEPSSPQALLGNAGAAFETTSFSLLIFECTRWLRVLCPSKPLLCHDSMTVRAWRYRHSLKAKSPLFVGH